MGWGLYAYSAAVRASKRQASAAESQRRHRERQRFERAAARMFGSPTTADVLEYLAMKAERSRSAEASAAHRAQAALIRAGHPYTVSADINTGRVSVKVLPLARTRRTLAP